MRTWGPLEKGRLLTTLLEAVALAHGFELDQPWHQLSPQNRDIILYGTGDQWHRAGGFQSQFKGLFPAFEEAARLSGRYRHRLGRVVRQLPCRACHGGRLNPVASAVRLHGRSLPDLVALPMDQSLAFLQDLDLDARQGEMAGELLDEVRRRLRFLVDVGLDYIALGRAAPTLSGGESQRVRLAGQIGSGLTGVLYVLDEPTIGLHPRDNNRLLKALKTLRDLGNTLIVVEHDRDTLEAADHLVDFGPQAGPLGGRIVAAGTQKALARKSQSLTGRYLAGDLAIGVPQDRRQAAGPAPEISAELPQSHPGWLTIAGARYNNLQDITVHLPLGTFICVTGPSGSGKSSLIQDTLYNFLAHQLHRALTVPEAHDAILGHDQLDKVIHIDQSPIGNSPRSDPATYTKVLDQLRQLYAQIPQARVRGYTAARFSYNQRGGRCEACWGLGSRRIEMHFLPDVWVECEECGGARYNRETLEVKYRGHSIADVLAMPVEQACALFARQPKIHRLLQRLVDVGLGYMHLGQPSSTLSGGEAQRVRLARELARPGTGRTLYLLDEPTTGLHLADVDRLLKVLQHLVENGNTVLVIEHNMDIAKAADWIVDLGPGGGVHGGALVAQGPPEEVAQHPHSPTAPFVAQALALAPRLPRRALILQIEDTAVEAEDLSQAQTPWEADGRQWHLAQRRLANGERPMWRPQALEHLIDRLEGMDGLAPAQWTARDHVTVQPSQGRKAFFARIRTDENWWFRVELRSEKGLFDQADLARRLRISHWDAVDQLQVYGKWPRIRVNARQKRWDTITLFLWNQTEMETPAFGKFIDACYAGYCRAAGLEGSKP